MEKRCDKDMLDEFKVRINNYIIAETKKKTCANNHQTRTFFELIVFKVLRDMGYNDKEFALDFSSPFLLNVFGHFLGKVGLDKIVSIKLQPTPLANIRLDTIQIEGTDCFSRDNFSNLKGCAWTLSMAIETIENQCGGSLNDFFR